MKDYGINYSDPEYGNFKINYGLTNEYIIANLKGKVKKESKKINQRIGVRVDEEWISHIDKISKIDNIVANKFLAGEHFDDWDEEFKKELDLLEGK